jgi:hypothetical protein
MRTLCLLFILSLTCAGQRGGGRGGRGGEPGYALAGVFGGLRLRSIGPASASDRVTSFAVNPENWRNISSAWRPV